MKTKVSFKVLGLFLMMCLFSFSLPLKATDNNFVTNEEKIGNLVVSKTIYKNEGSLRRHMKYDFTYDEQDRMTTKTAFKWDGVSEDWKPYFKISYNYTSDKIELIYARWNKRHDAFDKDVQKSFYELNDENLPIAFYKSVSNKSANLAMER